MNSDKKKAYDAKWRQLNSEKKKASDTRWAKLNSEKRKASNARWYKLNSEKCKASNALWRKLNSEKKKVANARWAKLNSEKKRVATTRWHKLNRCKINTSNAKRRKTEHGRQVQRLIKHRRRARKMNAPGFCTKAQFEARIAFYGWLCWMCRAPYEAIDHVIPLATTGSNWPANLRPACKSCNSKKGKRAVCKLSLKS